jgi:hypothetical protein
MPCTTSRLSEQQIVETLELARASNVASAARLHRVTAQAVYLWRSRYDTLDAEGIGLMRRLERDNKRLAQLLRQRRAEIDFMQSLSNQAGASFGWTLPLTQPLATDAP